MLQRYKLRLRDGTLLVVDHDALSTWLMDGRAMVQPVGSDRWRPLRRFLEEERAGGGTAWPRSSTPDAGVPASSRTSLDAEEPRRPVRVPPLPPPGGPPSPEPTAGEFAAPQTESTPLLPTADEEVPIAFPEPGDVEPQAPQAVDVPSQGDLPEPPPSISEPPGFGVREEEPAALFTESSAESSARLAAPDDEVPVDAPEVLDVEEAGPWGGAAPAWSDPLEPAPPLGRPSLQVLAEETARPRGRSTPSKPPSNEELPIIPLKLLDAEAPLRAVAPAEAGEDEEELAGQAAGLEGGFLGLGPPWDARVARWLDGLGRWVGHLGRWLDRVTAPRHGPSPSLSPGDRILALTPLGDEAEPSPRAAARPAADEAKATVQAMPGARALLVRFGGVASAWTDRLGKWVDDLGKRLDRARPGDRPSPSPSSDEPAAPGAAGPVVRESLKPPPPIGELPVLRLAKADEPEGERADHDIYGEPGAVEVAWRWVKRVTLITGLAAGGIVAAGTRDTWVPKAAEFGRTIVTEVDRLAHQSVPARPAELPPPVREALEAATRQLPHLTPEAIALVMSHSLGGVLGPSEVFGRAWDATERGLSALTPAEAQELRALRGGVLAALRPDERERLRRYDLARARRGELPLEERAALRSFARGARALQPSALERLQELSGKAIAAALPPQASSAPRAAAAR